MLKMSGERKSRQHSEPVGLSILRDWQQRGAAVWVYCAASDGSMSGTMSAQISHLSECLAFNNDDSCLRFDVKGARFEWGPLLAFLTPSPRGRAAALTSKPDGLVGRKGVLARLASGHFLFVCEATGSEPEWLALGFAGGPERLPES